jgi:serine protease Do
LAALICAVPCVLGDEVTPAAKSPQPASVSPTSPDKLVGEGEIVRGWLGLEVRNFIPPPPNPYHVVALYGALVDQVPAGSPAAAAGIRPGDTIISFANRPVATAGALNRAIAGTAPGAIVNVTVIRNGHQRGLTAKVGQREDRLLVVAGPLPQAGELGLAVHNGPPSEHGVVVKSVTRGSLAAEAGLRPDDVIVSVQGRPVADVHQYVALLQHRGPMTRDVQLGVRSAGPTERDVYLAPAVG